MQSEVQGELLCVTVTGNVDLNSSIRILVQTVDTAAQKRVSRVLVNTLAVTGTLTTLERYELATHVASHIVNLGTNPKIAFVGAPPLWTGFGVQVAQNRNVVVDWFHNLQEAQQWLNRWPNPT